MREVEVHRYHVSGQKAEGCYLIPPQSYMHTTVMHNIPEGNDEKLGSAGMNEHVAGSY